MTLVHAGLPHVPHDALTAWSFEPAVVAGIVALVVLHTAGELRTRGHTLLHRRPLAVRVAIGVLMLALVSPIDAIGAALFSVHMVQHLLLVAVAAPLLVIGDATGTMFRALPVAARRGIARFTRRAGLRGAWDGLCAPGPAFVLHAALLWLWHLPHYYDAALASELVHALEHITLLGSAFVFWMPLAGTRRSVRLPGGAAMLYLFAFGMQMSLLGALLAFANRAWYGGHSAWTAAWGLTPLEDQHIAGAIMWVPGGAIYISAAARLFLGWMHELERRAPVSSIRRTVPRAGRG